MVTHDHDVLLTVVVGRPGSWAARGGRLAATGGRLREAAPPPRSHDGPAGASRPGGRCADAPERVSCPRSPPRRWPSTARRSSGPCSTPRATSSARTAAAHARGGRGAAGLARSSVYQYFRSQMLDAVVADVVPRWASRASPPRWPPRRPGGRDRRLRAREPAPRGRGRARRRRRAARRGGPRGARPAERRDQRDTILVPLVEAPAARRPGRRALAELVNAVVLAAARQVEAGDTARRWPGPRRPRVPRPARPTIGGWCAPCRRRDGQ